MQKICIIGPSGSGKSTLAIQVAQKLNLPLFHLDQLFWQKNWEPIGTEKLIEKINQIITENETWIIDGNYGSSLKERVMHADTIIFLNYPRYIYFSRVIKRFLKNKGHTRKDMASGCNEKLDLDFLAFVWNFKKNSLPKVFQVLKADKPDSAQLITLTNPKETQAFLETLSS